MAPRILVCCVLARLVVSVDPNGCEIERWDDVAELLKAAG